MFMAEKERAAFRSARRLAVKLDLKADLKGPNMLAAFFSPSSGEASNTASDRSSRSASSRKRGCSSRLPGGDDTGVRFLLMGRTRRPRDALWGVSRGDRESVEKESVRDGTDSHDTARELDKGDAMVLSPIDKSSSSKSSGGLSRTSRGPLMKLKLSSFSEVWPCSMDSTVMRLSWGLTERCRVPRLGGGIEVTARRAATDAGMASVELTSRHRGELERCLRSS